MRSAEGRGGESRGEDVRQAVRSQGGRSRAADDLALFLGLAIGCIVLFGLFSEYRASVIESGDFGIIWCGPRALLDGADPYDAGSWNSERLRYGMPITNSAVYSYPPWVAIALLPLGALPFGVAATIWTAGGIVLAGLALRALLHAYTPGLPLVHALVGFVLLVSQPGVATFFSGQWGFVLVAAVAGAALFARSRRPIAGALSSLVFAAKPQYFVLLGWALLRAYIARHQPRYAFSLLAAGAVVLVASITVGRKAVASWLGAVSPVVAADQTATTLSAAFGDLGGGTGVVVAVLVLFAAIAIGLCFDPRGDSWLAVWIPLSSLGATYARSYDQVVLLPAVVIATGVIARRSIHLAVLFAAGTLAVFAVGSIVLYAVAASRNREDTSVALTILIFVLIVASQWRSRSEMIPEQGIGETGQDGIG